MFAAQSSIWEALGTARCPHSRFCTPLHRKLCTLVVCDEAILQAVIKTASAITAYAVVRALFISTARLLILDLLLARQLSR